MTFPKIELHVHLEGTVRARTLLQIARRNGVSLPADSVEGLADLYEFRDFAHFIEVWELTTCALRTAADFRTVVVDYAAEAASHGAVYLEGIFTPAEPVSRGARWEEVFEGYCDGAQQARELHGVQVRLTPEIARGYPLEAATDTARYALAYRDRGVVGVGLGGSEKLYPAEPYAPALLLARDGGLGVVPHAGELGDPEAVRTALDLLSSRRIRHGIGAARDRGLVREIAARGVVLDVCPVSNLRTRAVPSLAAHPLPDLVAAGVSCSVSTDDPAMFGTDLTADYAVAAQLGVDPRACYLAGLRGALCDEPTREMLRRAGDGFNWSAVAAVPGVRLCTVSAARARPLGAVGESAPLGWRCAAPGDASRLGCSVRAAPAGLQRRPCADGREPYCPDCGRASHSAHPSTAASAPTSDTTLAFAGDVHFTGRTAALLADPATAFGPIASVLRSADFTALNLETAITSGGTPEPKTYHFRTTPAAFTALRDAGVSMVTLANNHVLDYGQAGFADTLAAAHATGFPYVGPGQLLRPRPSITPACALTRT